jgi:hypothetical protein
MPIKPSQCWPSARNAKEAHYLVDSPLADYNFLIEVSAERQHIEHSFALVFELINYFLDLFL